MKQRSGDQSSYDPSWRFHRRWSQVGKLDSVELPWKPPPLSSNYVGDIAPDAEGIDIGATSHWVAVPRHLADESVREFGAMTDDLNARADRLLACGSIRWRWSHRRLLDPGVRGAGATGPEGLAGRCTTDEVRAGSQERRAGRQCSQKLMSLGLLRAAWRPDGEVCVVRAVARRREVLITEQASWFQPMQKALVQMNIQLTKVLRDVMGQTGQTIICAIVAGERDPQVLARHCNGRVKASVAETAAR